MSVGAVRAQQANAEPVRLAGRFERGLDLILSGVCLALGMGMVVGTRFGDLATQPWLYVGLVIAVLSLLRASALSPAQHPPADAFSPPSARMVATDASRVDAV